MDYTIDELMVVCISRRIQDGEMVAQGLATPLVAAGYLLARRTHAPNMYFASAIGQSVCRTPAPLGLTNIESLWLDRALIHEGFVRAAVDVLTRLRPLEFFRPAQVDPQGNYNNIALGKDYRRPRFRLPGTGGMPDVSIFNNNIHLYVPRHSRLTFVKKLDFISGLGHNPTRTHGSGPVYLITDLGQFDFAEGCMRLTSYHPGVTLDQIRKHTGFEPEIAPDLAETPPPTEEEIRLLREEIDPYSIRRLETLSGAERRNLMHWILKEEWKNNAGYSIDLSTIS
jgi:glutaconate CoA-transferase subunit B